MSNRIRLVRPSIAHKNEAIRFKNAFFTAGEKTIDGSELLDRYDSYEEWLSYVTDLSDRDTLREGSVLTDTFFAVDAYEKIVGIIDFRHELNEFFKDFGHCGYSVLPAERRKGYATEMLGMVVEIAKQAGLHEMQLSALRDNAASVKTIRNNGGKLVRSFPFYGMTADVFVISF